MDMCLKTGFTATYLNKDSVFRLQYKILLFSLFSIVDVLLLRDVLPDTINGVIRHNNILNQNLNDLSLLLI